MKPAGQLCVLLSQCYTGCITCMLIHHGDLGLSALHRAVDGPLLAHS